MSELTRQQKIERLRSFVERIKEMNGQTQELIERDAVLQTELDAFAARMEMEVFLREQGIEPESLLEMEQAKQELSALKEQRELIKKKLADLDAEYVWLEGQVEAIDVA